MLKGSAFSILSDEAAQRFRDWRRALGRHAGEIDHLLFAFPFVANPTFTEIVSERLLKGERAMAEDCPAEGGGRLG